MDKQEPLEHERDMSPTHAPGFHFGSDGAGGRMDGTCGATVPASHFAEVAGDFNGGHWCEQDAARQATKSHRATDDSEPGYPFP